MNCTQDNGICPGFSKRVNDDDILKGVRKFNRTVRLLFLAVIAVPTLIFIFVARGKYLWLGVALSAIFLLALLVREVKLVARKPWEGVVTEKFTKVRNYFSVTSSIASYSRATKYYLRVRMDDGTEKKKRLDNAAYYEYLNVGDRVRFLPKLNGCFEKYDKSHDDYLICPACLGKSDPKNDRCKHCGVPLLK